MNNLSNPPISNKQFVNLYLKTEYSLLSSGISLKKLANKMKEDNISSIAITDQGMHGVIKFYQICENNNVHPIIGFLLPLIDNNHQPNLLLLYALNEVGYHHLMEIATLSSLNSKLNLKDIIPYKDGILAITPCLENEIMQYWFKKDLFNVEELIKQYQNIFDEFYIGLDLQTKAMKNEIDNIMSYCINNHINVVGIHKTLYFKEKDKEVYATLRAIDLGINHYELTEQEENSYMISANDAFNLFSKYPILIENTNVISNKCSFKITFHQYKFPKYGINDSNLYLEELCKVGLNKRLKQKWERKESFNLNIYQNRLNYELEIIKKMGFSDYFLIVFDYVRYAKTNDILVGPGRGSAGGSLVSYALGITDIDPIYYDLLFERFLNPERISMPDIDVDIPDDRRDEVIKYIGQKYGKERVAHITTFGTLKARLAIRDVARVMAVDEIRLKEVMKYVPSNMGPNAPSLGEIISSSDSLKRLMECDPIINNLLSLACEIEGLPRNYSTHAAGIIMADCELNHYTPLQSGMNGLYQTQYEASDLESLGLLKMDILGLRNLNIIHQVLDEVKKRYNTKISLSNLNLNDHNVYTLFRKGDTTGIFQFESDGIRKVLRDLKTSSFTDIIHAVSLYRPGPMQMIPLFVNRKFGEKYEILHPDLKDILAPTYGTIVFQEQIMLIARTFAGYTLGEADILRRAVSKKKADVLEKERTKFVSASISKGYNEKLANEIYDYIEKFANYGFNKSHAVSYSLIAYWMAYLKTYYFPCFMSALMTNSIGSVSSLQQYVIECKKRNLEIFPPSIQESDEGFVYKNKGIYYSLLGITNVGNVAVKEILKEREKGQFTSFENFVYRTKNFLTKRMVINLIYAGSFDCFHHSRKSLVNIYDEVLEKSFYVNSLGNRLLEINYNEEEYTFEEISFHEKEALGFNLKYNLFLPYQSLKKEKNMTDLISLVDGRRYIILFTIDRIKEIQTKNNEKMAFLDIHDDTNNISAVLFSLAYKQYQPILIVGNIYYGECKTDTRNNQLQVIIDRLTKLT